MSGFCLCFDLLCGGSIHEDYTYRGVGENLLHTSSGSKCHGGGQVNGMQIEVPGGVEKHRAGTHKTVILSNSSLLVQTA